MTDLRELKEHIRWLEDERLDADAVEKRLGQINDDLSGIKSAIDTNGNQLRRLCDAYVGIAGAINRHTEALNRLKTAKERAAKRKPRKTKLSVVPGHDGGLGPPQEIADRDVTGTVKRKRGRPLGSKNKPKRKGGWPKGKPRKPQPEAA
jgi:hypothetical protein